MVGNRQIEFISGEFRPLLPDDCQINPGRFGFELALWLSLALKDQGIFTSYPQSDDWCWFLEYFQDDHEIMIGCYNTAGDSNGEAIPWAVFVRPYPSLRRFFGGTSPDAAVHRVTQAIKSVLAAKGFDVRQVTPAS